MIKENLRREAMQRSLAASTGTNTPGAPSAPLDEDEFEAM